MVQLRKYKGRDFERLTEGIVLTLELHSPQKDIFLVNFGNYDIRNFLRFYLWFEKKMTICSSTSYNQDTGQTAQRW